MTTDATPTSPSPADQPASTAPAPRKKRGVLKWIVLVVVLVVVIGVAVVFSRLNEIVRSVVESSPQRR
jgi:flagellar basal body-associated protein FliL